MDKETRKKVVGLLLSKDVLITPEFIDSLNRVEQIENLPKIAEQTLSKEDYVSIKSNLADFIDSLTMDENLRKDRLVVKGVQSERDCRSIGAVKVVRSYNLKEKKRDVQDFVKHFRKRYKKIESILLQRPELQSVVSISRILERNTKDSVAFIGLVLDKQYTKNNNIVLEVEDMTGSIKVIVTSKNPELLELCDEIVLDEVIGISGFNTPDKVVFANNIFFPDIPMTKELKKAPDEAYAIFISDIHVGSKQFLEKDFLKFIKWLRGVHGNAEQRRIASKVRYLFISGDLVDGVGIYPKQEEDLNIKDIYGQYERCAQLLGMIPKNIQIIACPGNHDAMRLSEPQPVFYKDFSKALYELENLTMVSNPSIVNIHSSEDFSGFDVLMYHGYSMNYFVRESNYLRSNGGYERSDLIMRFLLTKRHLAPSHGSSLYLPDANDDSLVIDVIPDFFLTGDIHYSKVGGYKNITMICGSCWQSITDFQIKVGHTNIETGRVAVVNLQTRSIKIMRFSE